MSYRRPRSIRITTKYFLGCRHLIELRRACYNNELFAPLDNIPSSTTSIERARIEEPENGFGQSYGPEHVSNINNSDQQNDEMLYSSNQVLDASGESIPLMLDDIEKDIPLNSAKRLMESKWIS
ncbi:uncharacterized protein LOC131323443 [Rhododendron vialii]|uniref:uncharacterized protein LOC131323443 n=1 Tax=Rhododendron vialii TaxID=182163 RepID=UPI002660162C|nr:uncharacterized protein LOC131323443 [Rhododendron vialii]